MHIIGCWTFVVYYDLEIVGIGIAATITNAIIYSSVIFYSSTLPDLQEATQVKFFSKDTYKGFLGYL